MANILFFFKLTITYLELKPRVLHSIYYITCKKKKQSCKSHSCTKLEKICPWCTWYSKCRSQRNYVGNHSH